MDLSRFLLSRTSLLILIFGILVEAVVSDGSGLTADSVHVRLRTNWRSIPWELEGIEWIYQRGGDAMFWDVLKEALDDRISKDTAHERYAWIVGQVIKRLGNWAVPPFKWALSGRLLSPKVELHSSLGDEVLQACPEIKAMVSKSVGSPFALVLRAGESAGSHRPLHVFVDLSDLETYLKNEETIDEENPELESVGDLLETDHLYPRPYRCLHDEGLNSITIVLHGNALDPSLERWHRSIAQLADACKVRYRFRHYVTSQSSRSPGYLHGYSVDLTLKSTEYVVVDDRKMNVSVVTKAQGWTGDSMSQDFGGLLLGRLKAVFPHHADRIRALEKRAQRGMINLPLRPDDRVGRFRPWEMEDAGWVGTAAIVSSDSPLDALKEFTEDFPTWEITAGMTLEKLDHVRNEAAALTKELQTKSRGVWIQGRKVSLEKMNEVVYCLEKLSQSIKLTEAWSSSLEFDPSRERLSVDVTSFRMDLLKEDPVLSYINDLELDERYQMWHDDYGVLDKMTNGGKMIRNLIPLRKNIVRLFTVLDPGDLGQLQHIQIPLAVVSQHFPIQVGVILAPGDPGSISEKVFSAFMAIALKSDGLSAVQFLGRLVRSDYDTEERLDINDVVELENLQFAFKQHTSTSLESILEAKEIVELVADARRWFAAHPAVTRDTLPLVSVNGLVLGEDSSELLHSVASEQLRIAKLVASKQIHPLSERPGHEVAMIGLKMVSKVDSDFMEFKEGREWASRFLPQHERKQELAKISYLEDGSASRVTAWLVGDLRSSVVNSVAIRLLSWLISQESAVRQNFRISLFDTGSSTGCFDIGDQDHNEVKILEILKSDFSECKPKTSISKLIPGVNDASAFTSLNLPHDAFVINGRVVGLDKLEHVENIDLIYNIEDVVALALPSSDISVEPDLRLMLLLTALGVETACSHVFETTSSNQIDTIFAKAKLLSSLYVEESDVKNRLTLEAIVDPLAPKIASLSTKISYLAREFGMNVSMLVAPGGFELAEAGCRVFHRWVLGDEIGFDEITGDIDGSAVPGAWFSRVPRSRILTLGVTTPRAWLIGSSRAIYDLDNIVLSTVEGEALEAEYSLESLLVEGSCADRSARDAPPQGLKVQLWRAPPNAHETVDTLVMKNMGYFQLKASSPGRWFIQLAEGRSRELYEINQFYQRGQGRYTLREIESSGRVFAMLDNLDGIMSAYLRVRRLPGKEEEKLLDPDKVTQQRDIKTVETVNIFSVASGHLYERFMRIMMISVLKRTTAPVKFWMLGNYLSPSFKVMLPQMAKEYGFQYEFVTYRWPGWLREQTEKQRIIWAYKILFLDVLFPLSVRRIIFVDADQVVRGDLSELYHMDLQGKPYGYVPFCNSRKEVEGFRFWKGGFWRTHLGDQPYHISALYVVDLAKFREMAAGDLLRYLYQSLSADPNSLSNLDQDLPNYASSDKLGPSSVPIFSLPKDWLWCESWCDDKSKKTAKVIDLCNNPMTKEPKLQAATRIIAEWKDLDEEAAQATTRAFTEAADLDRKGVDEAEGGLVDSTSSEDPSSSSNCPAKDDASDGVTCRRPSEETEEL